MKLLTLFALLCAVTLTTGATTVDYTLSVQNAPGGIGDFSWTVAIQGFIEDTPALFDANGNCLNCGRYNFTPIASSAPSNGQGCGISSVFMDPEYAITTFFSPLCDGLYDSTTAGNLPDPPGQFGTFTQTWMNPDNTLNTVTLAISDPPANVAVPEPDSLWLVAFGMTLLFFARQLHA